MSQTFGFVLLEGFDFRSYWGAVEALLAANVVTGRHLYRWARLSINGEQVLSADGVLEAADLRLDDDLPLDGLVVCAGPAESAVEKAPGWIEGLTERIDPVGGALILLSAPRAGADPPEGRAGAAEAFEVMLDLVDRQHGEAVVQAVWEWRRNLQEVRGRHTSLFERFGVRNEAVLRAIAFIGAKAADNPPSSEIAKAAGVSLKKLRALFAVHLGAGMKDLAFELRLTRVHGLVQMTSMPIDDVARTCGFPSTTSLVRAYRRRYGHSPKRERAISGPESTGGVAKRKHAGRSSSI